MGSVDMYLREVLSLLLVTRPFSWNDCQIDQHTFVSRSKGLKELVELKAFVSSQARYFCLEYSGK